MSPVDVKITLIIEDKVWGRSILGKGVSKSGQNSGFVRKKAGSNIIRAISKINMTRTQLGLKQ